MVSTYPIPQTCRFGVLDVVLIRRRISRWPVEEARVGASLGGERVDTSGDNMKILGKRLDFLGSFEGLKGVRPVGQYLVEESFGEGDEISLPQVFSHLEILGGAPEGDDVGGGELGFYAVAELGYDLECLGSAGEIVKLQRAGGGGGG